MKHVRRVSSTTVPECPVFRPTAEQFAADPFAYIKSITPEAMPYGIAKIILSKVLRDTPTPFRAIELRAAVLRAPSATSAHPPLPPSTRAGWKPRSTRRPAATAFPLILSCRPSTPPGGAPLRGRREAHARSPGALTRSRESTGRSARGGRDRTAEEENPGMERRREARARGSSGGSSRRTSRRFASSTEVYLDATVDGSGFASVPVGSAAAVGRCDAGPGFRRGRRAARVGLWGAHQAPVEPSPRGGRGHTGLDPAVAVLGG